MSLPSTVAAHLAEAKRQLAAYGPFSESLLSGGNLNHAVLLAGPDRLLVFRCRRDQAGNDIEAYLTHLYDLAGMPVLGGHFRLRSVAEEVVFIERARAAGVRTPAVLASGDGWMARDYVVGEPLGDVLRAGGNPSLVLRMLSQLMEAHSHGVVLGDRWGYNEIIDETGHLHFIDFDVAWSGPSDGAPDGLRNMDIAVALFGAVLFTSPGKDELMEAMREHGAPLLCRWGYDLGVIANVLDGYCVFYDTTEKRQTALSLAPQEYAKSLPHVKFLASLLRRRSRS